MKFLHFSKGLYSPIPGAQSAAKMYLVHLAKIFGEDAKFFVLTDKTTKTTLDFPTQTYLRSPPYIPNVPGLSFFWENFLATRAMQKICDRLKPDLVHIHGYAGFYPHPPRGFPVLLTFQDYPPMRIYDDFSTGPSKLFEFLWYDTARLIRLKRLENSYYFHAVSSEIANFLQNQGIESNQIFLIPNGISVQSHKTWGERERDVIKKAIGLAPSDRLILMVGQITYRKGIHRVLRALDHLPPHFHLILDGKPLPIVGGQYMRAILSSKHKKRVHYIGYSPRHIIQLLFHAADCYVSMSLSEACQLTLLEALFFRTPVVVSDVGAVRDVLSDNEQQYIVKNSDDSKSLALLIKNACSSSKRDLSLTDFHWDASAYKMKAAYENILSEKL